jgi:ribonuclease HI
VRRRGDVTFSWVKGHSGDAMNDLVDALAVEAAQTGSGRSGRSDPPTGVNAGG